MWKAFAMQESKWTGIVMLNTKEQSQWGCTSAHEILRASCHPTLHGFYGDVKSLRLMRLLWASYLKVLEIYVCTCHTGLVELILGQNI